MAQLANSIYLANGTSRDDLLVVQGRILENIQAQYQYRNFLNTEYIDEPVKGGSVKIKRFKNPVSQNYGTARTAGAANKLINTISEIKVDTDKEITEEMNAKDKNLYFEQGGVAFLNSRLNAYVLAMGLELEKAYYVGLQNAATANGFVTLSGGANIREQILILIRALEAKRIPGYIEGVDRSEMVVTVAPEFFDSLESVMATLPNPRNGGQNARFFGNVEITPATRQGFDAIIQYRGAIAQPVVMDDFKVDGIELSNDVYAYLSYYYGTGAILSDLVLGGAISGTISA